MPKQRKFSEPQIEIHQFTPAEIETGIRKLNRRIEELRSLDPESTRFDDAKRYSIESNIRATIGEVFGINSPEFREHGYHRIWQGGISFGDSDYERQAKFAAGVPQSITMLEGLISRLEEKKEYMAPAQAMPPSSDIVATATESQQVFIVHGHDELNTLKLKDLLEELWHLEPIVLRGEPGKGRTLIEKFEQEAQKAVYAFVLFTPDDLVEVQGTTYTQARPNAIFELGWFYGRLTRQRVCILFKKGTKIPSDLDGITRIEFDNSIDEKVVDIERELRAANLL